MTAVAFDPTPADIAFALQHLNAAERYDLTAILTALDTQATTGRRPLPDVDYQLDPIGWARDVAGIDESMLRWSLHAAYQHHVWDGTRDPLAVILESLAGGQNVGVESGTGVGKTFLGAFVAAWFLVCFPDAIVVTTAPKKEQLTLHLWKELGALLPHLRRAYPALTKMELRVRLKARSEDGADIADDEDWSKERWAIIGYACGVDAETTAMGRNASATRAKGFHARHMLIITEETQGIHPAIMAALQNTCTGDHNLQLALGNPLWQGDELHRFCDRPDVVHVRASALDHPNVVRGDAFIPGAVGRKSVEARRVEYEDTPQIFDAQVRGISPAQAANALIQKSWCLAAHARYTDPAFRSGGTAKGVDVAQSEAGDKAAIATGEGACLVDLRVFACTDATALGTTVWNEAVRDKVSPQHIGVDSVGIGAATVNELRLKAHVTRGQIRALNGGSKPVDRTQRAPDGSSYNWAPDANSFMNLRSQMWWQMREDLRRGLIALPPDETLVRELCTPTFTDDRSQTVVESKDGIRKRLGGRSPDRADAAVYWNWVRPRTPLPIAPAAPDPRDFRRDLTVLTDDSPRRLLAAAGAGDHLSTFAHLGE